MTDGAVTISGETIALIMLAVTASVHLVTTVWWAASVTKRVEHLEKWIAQNGQTAERLAALEQRIDNIGGGILRIEHYLRQRE